MHQHPATQHGRQVVGADHPELDIVGISSPWYTPGGDNPDVLTALKEIEASGGRGLAFAGDVRHASVGEGAVAAAVGKHPTNLPVKILAGGEIDRALTVRVEAISAAARARIEAAGGSVELIGEAPSPPPPLALMLHLSRWLPTARCSYRSSCLVSDRSDM